MGLGQIAAGGKPGERRGVSLLGMGNELHIFPTKQPKVACHGEFDSTCLGIHVEFIALLGRLISYSSRDSRLREFVY
jgi:hypothetical protein